MLSNFKKLGVAAAVASALGAAGAAQAITLGAPGTALLIPIAQYDTNAANGVVNTLVGVTVGDGDVFGNEEACGDGGKGAVSLHWYLYDEESQEAGNGAFTSSCNDFFRIDLGYLIRNYAKKAEGKSLYFVVTNERESGWEERVPLYGAAYIIEGNWASMAFVPVLPLVYPSDVEFAGPGSPKINPEMFGMELPWRPERETRFSLRYFLDQDLNGRTQFVLWFPDNNGDSYYSGDNANRYTVNRTDVPVWVFDADETYVSDTVDLPNELNVIDVTSEVFNGLDNPTPTTVPVPDLADSQPAVDSGFVTFYLNDLTQTQGTSSFFADRHGIAFSLIHIGTDANPDQVQTELAHERGTHRMDTDESVATGE